MRDLFVGICHSLKNANIKYGSIDKNDFAISNKIDKKECLDVNDYYINSDNINFEDEGLRDISSLEIEFTEFAPKAFKQLRRLETLPDEELIKYIYM